MSNDPSKKIIVDEDWKTKVEAEREALRHGEEGKGEEGKEAAAAPAGDTPPPAAPAAEKPAAEAPAQHRPLPPPDLVYLAGTVYMQALVSLGLIPNPLTKKPTVDLPHARHAIDSLEMLRVKTEGNRTPQETEAIDQMLHELRMTFIEVQSTPGGV